MQPEPAPLSIEVKPGIEVSALLLLPPAAHTLFVFAHGAGAGMNHAFMADLSQALATRNVGTLRYQFPYMEKGSGRPDAPALCHATVRGAVAEARKRAPQAVLIAGGKSFGGRMTSQAQASEALADVQGLAFVGFPLHLAKKPAVERGAHLKDVTLPMLFLQGTRDDLADLSLLEPLVEKLGVRATLKRIEGADHSFHVLVRSGRNDREVMQELADTMAAWAATLTLASAKGRG